MPAPKKALLIVESAEEPESAESRAQTGHVEEEALTIFFGDVTVGGWPIIGGTRALASTREHQNLL